MKNLVFGLLLLFSAGAVSSCRDQDKIPEPEVTSVPLIFPQASSDPQKTFFNWGRSAAASSTNPVRPVFEFTIDLGDQRDVKVRAVEVYKSYRRGSAGQIGPRTLVREVTTFPTTISMTSQEAITGIKRIQPRDAPLLPTLASVLSSGPTIRNAIVIGDRIIFTFEYVLEDGSRVVLTPITKVAVDDPTTPIIDVISGTQINAPYAIVAEFRVQ